MPRATVDSYALKLERAHAHLATLMEQERAFLSTKPAEIVPERDYRNHRIVLRFKINSQPPAEWGPLIGDFIFNLRSSLDHVIYQLTLRHSGRPVARSGFPIFDEPHAFHARRSNGHPASGSGLQMIRGISEEAQRLVEGAQPYNNEQGFRRDPLWVINKLSNIDKHRTLHVAVTYPARANFFFSVPFEQDDFVPGPRFEDGSIIARFRVAREVWLDSVRVTGDLDSQVVLDEGDDEPITRPLGGLCETLFTAVTEDVMPALTSFL